jgi:hypothetical protein
VSGQEWRRWAACADADPDLAFGDAAEADLFVAQFCRHCPVRRECLAYGMARDDPGVYGGLTRRERKALKEPRPRSACGTGPGYQRHWRDGEPACEPCLKAHSAVSNAAHKARRAAA